MKDFPLFDTESGISSLILREVPYRQEAYIRCLDVPAETFSEHLKECVSFCRMVGAESVYAADHACLREYPVHTTVIEMRGEAAVDRDRLKHLFPVTEKTVGNWRRIYNEQMASVDNATTLESRDENRILESGGAYFIHDAGELLGIGWMEDTKLLAIAGVKPGVGWLVANALLSTVEGADVTLEVASTNEKALKLYGKLGFVPVREVTRWHRVFPLEKECAM